MSSALQSEILMLLGGLGNTLLVSVVGIAVGIFIGIVFGGLRAARVPVASQFIGIYVNLFRCTPLLVQIVMLYFALPDIGIRLSPFETSCLALSLWGGAYQTEVFRAGFGAVPKGEIVAARALGMPAFQTFLDIVLPLGLRASIPAATTTAITQFRSSSFMVVIGYAELTYVANQLVSETFQVFKIFGMAALMYLIVCSLISVLSRALERYVHIPGIGVAK